MSDWSDLQYVAIVGVGRSGTTLLMSMLNAHPEVTFPPEFHFINQHLAKEPKATLDEAVLRLQNDTRFQRLQLDLDEVIRPFKGERPFSMPALYQEILQYYAQQQNVKIIGDKAPKYVEYLPTIKHIFPKAKIIHLIRDPRDVYLSRTKAAWSSDRSDILQFLAYRSQYNLGRHQGPQLFGTNYMEVQYENLLLQPAVELKKICQMLDIAFANDMLQFSKSAKQLVASDEMSWKKEVLGPLLTNNMNKWEKELTPKQIARIETACTPTFQDGLYAKAYPSSSPLNSLFYNRAMAILSTIYKNNVKFKNWRVNQAIT